MAIETRREQLQRLTGEFLDAFNRCDLDGVMAFFADDGAVYDEFTGTANEGLDAIRAAFTPQFEGAFGDMKFIDEDLFIDDIDDKVMASWRCTLVVKGQATAWRGLDLIHWRGDEITHKSTYAKTKVPLFE
ncbi:MAG: nuclear transport factor 2 family protein [Acidimicrobiia bacterium]|nr:nuclear transport factor 2 family protein [Acidimicrobiia bacterium]